MQHDRTGAGYILYMLQIGSPNHEIYPLFHTRATHAKRKKVIIIVPIDILRVRARPRVSRLKLGCDSDSPPRSSRDTADSRSFIELTESS